MGCVVLVGAEPVSLGGAANMSAPVPVSCRWHFLNRKLGYLHTNLYPGFIQFLLRMTQAKDCVDADLHVRMSDGTTEIIPVRGRQ